MTVDIKQKPKVDLDELEKARLEEEKKLDKTPPDDKSEGDDAGSQPDDNKADDDARKKEEQEWKNKFKESQKEAMVLRKQLEEKEAEKNKKVEVTDEFLKEKYSDWEDMTPGEQRAVRLAEEARQELADIKNKTNEYNNDRQWSEKVDSFLDGELDDLPENIQRVVEAKKEEFKRFATRPTRKGLPLDDLAKIFCFDHPEAPAKKRTLFNPPGGAGKKPEKPTMTASEIADLRKTDNRKYMQLVREGVIKIDL